MAVTALNDIEVGSSLALTADLLGDFARAAVAAALKAPTVTLGGCAAVTQNARQLIVTGTLPDLPGRAAANVPVRLYLFDVPTILATTERHVLLLISELPNGYRVDDLWNAYATGGPSAVTAMLGGSTFADPMLLLSSLDYGDVRFIDPPFPPVDEKLSGSQKTFISGFAKEYVTRGFSYRIATSLDGTKPVPGAGITFNQALTPLSLTAVCQAQKFLAQTRFGSAGTDLVLFFFFSDPAKPPTKAGFDFELDSIGLAFPLGVTKPVLPQVQLRGSITIGATVKIEADFDLASRYLTLILTGFPKFEQLAAHFVDHFQLKDELGSFLPDQHRFDALGSIALEEVAIGFDFAATPAVDFVRLVIAAEKSLPLMGDVLAVQPALSVRIDRPFDKARSFEVDLTGRWLIEHAEIDTTLAVEPHSYQVTAGLALGQTLNLSRLLGDVLGGQVEGIPDLSVSGFDFIGFKSDAGSYYEVELDLDLGWHLGDLPLTLDEVHLEAAFTDGKMTEAGVSATVELGTVPFTLAAAYAADNRGWTFSGGMAPGATIKVGDFMAGLVTDLGVDSHNKFLEPFEPIEITGLYVEYRTYQGRSSQMSLFLSLQAGATFGDWLPLDKILVRFQTDGSGTLWRFDATASGDHDASKLLEHIGKTQKVALHLPESLTSLRIEELGGYYDSSLGNYGFTAYLKFNAVSVYLQIDLIKQGGGRQTEVRGQLVFNEKTKDELTFELRLDSTAASTDFVAIYRADGATPLSLASLVEAITGKKDHGIPADFSIDIRNALFSHHGSGANSKSIFAIDMDSGINLSGLGDLPIIGSQLSAAKTLTLAFQILYATTDYSSDDLKALNRLLPKDSTFKFPEAATIRGAAPDVNAQVRRGADGGFGVSLPVGLNPDSGQLQPQAAGPPPPNAVTTDDGIQWFDLKKDFGPLNLSRVGFKASGVEVTGYLDGGLSLMGLTVELLGLSVSTKLTGPDRFKPAFGLNGLAIDFKNGPLEIGGAFYKVTEKDITEFDGLAIIRTGNFQLNAIGSFAELAGGTKSLFIYAVLDYPLGGPAFFYVTGLAAGFGYNRQLLIPDVSQLDQFPLIAEAMTSRSAPPPSDMSQMKAFISGKIGGMQAWIPPQVGEYFVAVGVRFTSFELLDSFALLTVQFGKHFEIDVLGLSTMLVPPNVSQTPIAEAQLLLKATIVPDEGIVLVQEQLTSSSYILSRDCHLTGGFAFASWLKGDHAGDFVVSLGGYHPDFKVPGYYPRVPRVGFNWTVNAELSLKGGGYYALVPHAFMAGGYLNALYESSNVKAWFNLNANFLMMWKPFHYDVEVSVDMGIDVVIQFFGTHHIGLEAAADLHLWGPEFGGHAAVSLKVIGITFHFSIDFGAAASPPPPIPWSDFQATFLPANDKIASLSIERGLERTVRDDAGHDVLVINRQELRIVTSSTLPIKSLGGSFSHATDALFVAPMNAAVAESEHCVTFSNGPVDIAKMLVMEPIMRPVPAALWGPKMQTELNQHSMLPAMTGVRLTPLKPSDPGPTEIVSRSRLAYDTTRPDKGYRFGDLKSFAVTRDKAAWKDVEANILDQAVADARAALLKGMGFDPGQFICNQPFSQDTVVPPQYGEWG